MVDLHGWMGSRGLDGDNLSDVPFILMCECSVTYAGRATSTLQRGRYLIIHKADGTTLVHGADLVTPKNYQGPGASISINGNVLTATRSTEVLHMTVYNIFHLGAIHGLSNAKIDLRRSEKELVKAIANDPLTHLNINATDVVSEFDTGNGPVDLKIIDKNGFQYFVEVKRKQANLNAVTQLGRYLEHHKNTKAYLAAPCISKTALAMCKRLGYKFVAVSHA